MPCQGLSHRRRVSPAANISAHRLRQDATRWPTTPRRTGRAQNRRVNLVVSGDAIGVAAERPDGRDTAVDAALLFSFQAVQGSSPYRRVRHNVSYPFPCSKLIRRGMTMESLAGQDGAS